MRPIPVIGELIGDVVLMDMDAYRQVPRARKPGRSPHSIQGQRHYERIHGHGARNPEYLKWLEQKGRRA